MSQRPTWTQLDFAIAAEDEDAASETLAGVGLPGWETLEGPPGELILRVWVLPEDAPRVAAALHPLTRRPPEPRPLDGSWMEDWAPERVGPFVIRSLGAPVETVDASEHLVLLAPELAFGGGEHPTTRLCLHRLLSLVEAGSAVLDVGCGSGVLSVAAARLGATRIDATDVDPTARRATLRAAAANQVEISVLEGGLEQARPPYGLVMANILAPVLIDLAPALRASLAPGGALLLSGVRVGHAEAVIRSQPSLVLEHEDIEEGWAALTFRGA